MSSELEKAGDGFASPAPRNLQKSIDLEEPRASLLKLEGISMAQRIRLEELSQLERAQSIKILEIEVYEKGERIRLHEEKLALASAEEVTHPLISNHPNVASGNISPSRISAQPQQGGGATPLKEAPQWQISLLGQLSKLKRSSPPKRAAMYEQSDSDSAHLTPVVAPAVYVKETSSSRAMALTGNSLERVVVERTEKDASDPKIGSPADKEVENKIIFLRKLAPGGSTHSFGIHVARMAGMPQDLIKRADEILADLEKKQPAALSKEDNSLELGGVQLSIFDTHTEVFTGIREMLGKVDINNLTPVDALVILNEIKKKIN